MQVPETEVIVTGADGAELLRTVLIPGEYVIGRNTDCELPVVADLVSRKHALLTINFDHALIEDIGSSNGTFINGQPIKECTRLWPNQKIQLGTATLELHRIKTVPPPGVSLAPTTAAVRRILPKEFLGEKKYDIGGMVARGGMGAILDAKEAAIERRVAMKVMLDGYSPDDLTRFVAEAKITGQLEHPNIVPVHELGVDENDQVFYTMKFVGGITLRKVLDLMAAGTEATLHKYPLATLLTIFQKVCDALAFAHSKSVIHRDLKPENIMIGDFGEVLLMDWGLAKLLSRDNAANVSVADTLRSVVKPVPLTATDGSMTLDGSIMGTPQYMAPEQARGEVDALDARSDVYSLGAILFHLLYLRAPVSGQNVREIVAKVAEGHLEWPDTRSNAKKIPHLPGGRTPDSLLAVCRKALSLNPAERYQSIAALQKDVAAYQAGFATGAENASFMKQIVLLIKRNKGVFATAFAAWLIITAMAVWFVLRVRASERLASAQRDRAEQEKARAEKTLAELRGTAPTFEAQSHALIAEGKLDEALAKIGYAVNLAPENSDYHLSRAHLLQSTEQLSEAADEYRQVLALHPGDGSAKLNLDLCEKLLNGNGGAATLPVALENKLLDALIAQHRDLEAAPLATRLNRDTQTARATILARLSNYTSQKAWPGSNRLTPVGDKFRLDLTGLQLGDLNALRGMPISELILRDTQITDLRPLAGLPLEVLNLEHCPVSDLSPLRGMKLREINFYDTTNAKVKDISPLAGMPLEIIDMAGPLDDLSPLRGAPLKRVDIHGCKRLRDLSPLEGMKIEILIMNYSIVTDIGPLHGMPLKALDLAASNVRDCSPLSGNATLERIALPLEIVDIAFLHSLPKLQWVSLKPHVDLSHQSDWVSAHDFLAAYDPQLPEIKTARDALAAAGIKDLAARRVSLDSDHRLTLDLTNVAIKDIRPLRGLPIKNLNLLTALVGNIEPLRGMPLTIFRVSPLVSDIGPLADCPELEQIQLSDNSKLRNVEQLRALPKLHYISKRWDENLQRPAQTAEEFWKEYDAQQAAEKN